MIESLLVCASTIHCARRPEGRLTLLQTVFWCRLRCTYEWNYLKFWQKTKRTAGGHMKRLVLYAQLESASFSKVCCNRANP